MDINYLHFMPDNLSNIKNIYNRGGYMSQVVEYCHYPLSPIRLHDQGNESEATTDVLLADPELAKPPMYAVVMYNDDYTPMDFVVDILQTEFRHNLEQAVDIMLNIHHQGRGIAGIYPKDIAETKAQKVNNMARREGYPLLTQIEPHLDS